MRADEPPTGLSPEETQAWADKQRAKRDKPAAGFTRADQVEVKPTDWLVEGWMARDSLAAIVGPSGSCKSFLAIDWACRVATGTPWHGCDVKRGAVFILAGEGRNGLRKRIEGWSVHSGVPIGGAPLYLAQQLPRLDVVTTAGILAEIDALATATEPPALIVIDTVARALAGDENSSEHMGVLIECADWLRERYPGCVVALVHHTGHANNGRARGSSAFYAALDSEVLAKPLKSGDVQLFQTKAKDWEPPRPMQFRRHRVEITVPGTDLLANTLVLVNTELTTTLDKIARRNEINELKASGKSVREIAEETGIPKSTVDRMLKSTEPERPIWEEEFS